MSETRTEVITDFAALRELAGEWDRLWRADPRRTVFGCFAWADTFWRIYGPGLSLRAIVVRRGERVCGILPLAAEGQTLGFLSAARSDYNDMLCEQDCAAEAVASAVAALSGAAFPWRRCVLVNLPEDSNIVTHLPAAGQHAGLHTHLSFSAVCPNVDLAEDAERILGKILKKKSLRRHENKLARSGQLTFRHLESREEAKAHLPAFFRQHVARRAMTGDRSIFCDRRARDFYERLVDELDPRAELRFSVVELDDRPVAYHFGFEGNQTFIWYKPTFDVDLWAYSPGEVLIKKLVEYVRDRGLKKFDFTVGAESFKRRFANRVTHNYALHVLPSGPRGRAGRLALKARDWLKKHPVLFRAVKGVAACPRRLRRGLGGATLGALRRAIYDRHVVRVCAVEAGGPGGAADDPPLEQATLGELACLAARHGDCLTAGQLAEMRGRLKRGDKLHALHRTADGLHLAWTGLRSELLIRPRVGKPLALPLESECTVVFGDRVLPAAPQHEAPPDVIGRFLDTIAREGKPVRVICPTADSALARCLGEHSAALACRVVSMRILGVPFRRVDPKPVTHGETPQ